MYDGLEILLGNMSFRYMISATQRYAIQILAVNVTMR